MKIRKEMQNAIDKDDYLNDDDAVLINKFLRKLGLNWNNLSHIITLKQINFLEFYFFPIIFKSTFINIKF